MTRSFHTKIAGVTKPNTNGTDRQSLLKRCRAGEKLLLVREPQNPYDKHAIAIYTVSREQLGYVPAGDLPLANHMDMGGTATAEVVRITGGSGFFARLFGLVKNYGAVIRITKTDPADWAAITAVMQESREIENRLNRARGIESSDKEAAIAIYRQCIAEIEAIDNRGTRAAASRRVRYPINRLSLMLARVGRKQDALEAIMQYESRTDVFGLSAGDDRALTKRKARLQKL